MATARIVGVDVNVDKQEVAGLSPLIVNGYVNEAYANVKRPGLEALVYGLDPSSGISGFYDWEDQSQIIVTQYNGNIWRINASGVTQLDSASVRCGSRPAVFDGNGQKLWIASGGKLINILADTPANGAVYLPAYTTEFVQLASLTTSNATSVQGTTTLSSGCTATDLSLTINPQSYMTAGLAVIFPASKYNAVQANNAIIDNYYEIVNVTVAGTSALTVTRAYAGTAYAWQEGDFIVGPVSLGIYAPPSNVTHVAYYDGYIVCNSPALGQMWFNDGPALSPSDPANDLWTQQRYLTAEYKPDPLIALFTWYHELYLFGTRSIEVWYNDGYSPFSHVEGAQADVGLISPYSVVSYNNIPYFMTSERTICTYNGRQPTPISQQIQAVLDNMTIANDVIASVISDNGQNFLLFSFDSADQAWAYNIGTQTWSKWMNPSVTGRINIGVAVRIQDTSFNSSDRSFSIGYAGTVLSSSAPVTSFAWTNAANVEGEKDMFVSGLSFASFAPTSGLTSDWLKASNFGVSVPDGATITGIEAAVYAFLDQGYCNSTPGDYLAGDFGGIPPFVDQAADTDFTDAQIYLTGAACSGSTTTTIGNISIPENVLKYGGINNTWGLKLSNPDLSDLGFKWRASATRLTSNGTVLKIYAMSLKVYYAMSLLVSNSGATWAGDPKIGKIYNISSKIFSDQISTGTEAIEWQMETPPLNYNTLKPKQSQLVRLRYRTNSHAVRMKISDEFKPYGNSFSIPANTGVWMRRNLGMFTTRQYKFTHKQDCAFSFVEFEEDVISLK